MCGGGERDGEDARRTVRARDKSSPARNANEKQRAGRALVRECLRQGSSRGACDGESNLPALALRWPYVSRARAGCGRRPRWRWNNTKSVDKWRDPPQKTHRFIGHSDICAPAARQHREGTASQAVRARKHRSDHGPPSAALTVALIAHRGPIAATVVVVRTAADWIDMGMHCDRSWDENIESYKSGGADPVKALAAYSLSTSPGRKLRHRRPYIAIRKRQ